MKLADALRNEGLMKSYIKHGGSATDIIDAETGKVLRFTSQTDAARHLSMTAKSLGRKMNQMIDCNGREILIVSASDPINARHRRTFIISTDGHILGIYDGLAAAKQTLGRSSTVDPAKRNKYGVIRKNERDTHGNDRIIISLPPMGSDTTWRPSGNFRDSSENRQKPTTP